MTPTYIDHHTFKKTTLDKGKHVCYKITSLEITSIFIKIFVHIRIQFVTRKMEIHLAFLQLLFSPIFCNEILHGPSNEVSLKNETEDFEDFKAFTLKKIGELEYEAFNLKEENRILREKMNVIEQDG